MGRADGDGREPGAPSCVAATPSQRAAEAGFGPYATIPYGSPGASTYLDYRASGVHSWGVGPSDARRVLYPTPTGDPWQVAGPSAIPHAVEADPFAFNRNGGVDFQRLVGLGRLDPGVEGAGGPAPRAPPSLTSNPLYKTELCRSWMESGYCRYGSKCQFAHGVGDLRPIQRHPKYKTEICRTYAATGNCPYGPRCRFIHGVEPVGGVTGGGGPPGSPPGGAAAGAGPPASLGVPAEDARQNAQTRLAAVQQLVSQHITSKQLQRATTKQLVSQLEAAHQAATKLTVDRVPAQATGHPAPAGAVGEQAPLRSTGPIGDERGRDSDLGGPPTDVARGGGGSPAGALGADADAERSEATAEPGAVADGYESDAAKAARPHASQGPAIPPHQPRESGGRDVSAYNSRFFARERGPQREPKRPGAERRHERVGSVGERSGSSSLSSEGPPSLLAADSRSGSVASSTDGRPLGAAVEGRPGAADGWASTASLLAEGDRLASGSLLPGEARPGSAGPGPSRLGSGQLVGEGRPRPHPARAGPRAEPPAFDAAPQGPGGSLSRLAARPTLPPSHAHPPRHHKGRSLGSLPLADPALLFLSPGGTMGGRSRGGSPLGAAPGERTDAALGRGIPRRSTAPPLPQLPQLPPPAGALEGGKGHSLGPFPHADPVLLFAPPRDIPGGGARGSCPPASAVGGRSEVTPVVTIARHGAGSALHQPPQLPLLRGTVPQVPGLGVAGPPAGIQPPPSHAFVDGLPTARSRDRRRSRRGRSLSEALVSLAFDADLWKTLDGDAGDVGYEAARAAQLAADAGDLGREEAPVGNQSYEAERGDGGGGGSPRGGSLSRGGRNVLGGVGALPLLPGASSLLERGFNPFPLPPPPGELRPDYRPSHPPLGTAPPRPSSLGLARSSAPGAIHSGLSEEAEASPDTPTGATSARGSPPRSPPYGDRLRFATRAADLRPRGGPHVPPGASRLGSAPSSAPAPSSLDDSLGLCESLSPFGGATPTSRVPFPRDATPDNVPDGAASLTGGALGDDLTPSGDAPDVAQDASGLSSAALMGLGLLDSPPLPVRPRPGGDADSGDAGGVPPDSADAGGMASAPGTPTGATSATRELRRAELWSDERRLPIFARLALE